MSAHTQETRLEILRRRTRVATILAGGAENVYTVMAKLGLEIGDVKSHRTISRDMKIIRRWWRMKVARKYDVHIGLMAARLERVLDEAWSAWERSKLPRESTRSRTSKGRQGDSTAAELKKEQRDGNPKFLELIVKTIDKLCELLDLYPARRILHSDTETAPVAPPARKYDLSRLSADDCQTLKDIRARIVAPKPNSN
jgi:hypothetical protein